MSSLETTELKLKTTPTGGVEAAHSPYYRRLLSAGYKGFLQGTIGGGSLYGVFGGVIGTLVALPLAPLTGGASLALIPALAGLGLMKGADTFGQIGSMAAITAESSELSEQRRYLLDRYYDLPNGPEGDREAEAIKQELLKRAGDHDKAPPFFHWKTVAVCALAGAALAIGAVYLAPLIGAGQALMGMAATFGHGAAHATLMTGAIGGLAGSLAGATIGIDRYYIRKWFDHTQNVVHSTSHDYGMAERHRGIEKIIEAAKQDEKTKQTMASEASMNIASAAQAAAAPATQASTVAYLQSERPTNTISESRRLGALQLQQALSVAPI